MKKFRICWNRGPFWLGWWSGRMTNEWTLVIGPVVFSYVYDDEDYWGVE